MTKFKIYLFYLYSINHVYNLCWYKISSFNFVLRKNMTFFKPLFLSKTHLDFMFKRIKFYIWSFLLILNWSKWQLTCLYFIVYSKKFTSFIYTILCSNFESVYINDRSNYLVFRDNNNYKYLVLNYVLFFTLSKLKFCCHYMITFILAIYHFFHKTNLLNS